jgi:SET domain-containing protein
MSQNGLEPALGLPTNGVSAPLYVVRNSPIHGRGVFAARRIRKGTKILEYKGERISNREADRRYDDTKMKRHHTFLFTLDKRTVIDGALSAGGGDASYINHSCDPNCEAIITGKRIFIHALTTIEPGDELAYDYQYERTGENDDELEKFYLCKCGAENCRGTIMKLRRDVQRSRVRNRKKPSLRNARSHKARK